MPYVRRNPSGQIDSLHSTPSAQAPEFIDGRHPELLAFAGLGFNGLDAEFVRVTEDVIDTLIIKNVINITDLPSQAQLKLLARKSFRERVSKHSLRSLDATATTPSEK